jgi:phosphate starvation-inducible protein PhoH and related proteins
MGKKTTPRSEKTPLSHTHLVFEDKAKVLALFGVGHEHLDKLEERLGVEIHDRGNHILISGQPGEVKLAEQILEGLYEMLNMRDDLSPDDVSDAIKLAQHNRGRHTDRNYDDRNDLKTLTSDRLVLRTTKKSIYPRTETQGKYIESILRNDCVFGLGPAGTGKTYLAAAAAVAMLQADKVDRIILCRPAIEAGERLGFLPGDLKEKVDPYLRPLYDALEDVMLRDKLEKAMIAEVIEVAPLAFMRGRTLARAFVILDEAQNTTPMQMKMFLTRLGEGSRMVITGDLTQIDLPGNIRSGLHDALEVLKNVQGVDVITFNETDVVRHPLVGRIVHAYDKRDKKNKTTRA